MNTSRTPKSKPEPNASPPVVNATELYPLDELCRRLRWRRHSRQQALRKGLKSVLFGSRRYVKGSWALAFFDQLLKEQDAVDAQ